METKFRPAGAIFDMDGLMLDTERPLIPGFVQAGKTLGWDISIEMATRTVGISMGRIREMLKEEYGPEFPLDDFHRELSKITTETFQNGIAHKPGLTALLDHFSSMGIPMIVATSANRKRAFWKLEIAGILERFTAVITRDDVANGKPAPDIFLLAASTMGFKPSACVGFEDSPAGLQGLHAAGIRSVFVKDIVEPSEEILSRVWRRCEDLTEAVKLFG